MGHTHVQGSRNFDEGLIVNPGSVGQPRNGDCRAAYSIVDLEVSSVELKRVEYPIQEVKEKIRKVELPKSIGERLSEGR